MSGRKAPNGIPQPIWDEAIAIWMELSAVDNGDIKRIAGALMRRERRALNRH